MIFVLFLNREETGDNRTIEYDRLNKGFVMRGNEESTMTNSEIFAVTKILLESRAFTKKEMNSIISKMVDGCVHLKNMKLVSDLIANEKCPYRSRSICKGNHYVVTKSGHES